MYRKKFIRRAFDLARLGAMHANPNPMVGAVLVHQDRIIGEGYHQQYGGPHAEVNAVADVSKEDRLLLSKSTLYVSLEPCNIQGHTPPCSDLILQHRIPKVVISVIDHTPGVDGSSVEKLRKMGVEVITNCLPKKGQRIAAFRNTFITKRRPYIILKWAASQDGFMGKVGQSVWISSAISKRLVHRWRSETAAILVGTNTALTDNPALTTRWFEGPHPLRILLDSQLKTPATHHLLADPHPTLILHHPDAVPPSDSSKTYISHTFDAKLLPDLLKRLYEQKINSLLVEGGAKTLRHFIDQGLWDEGRVFTSSNRLGSGIAAPVISGIMAEQYQVGSDILEIIRPLDSRLPRKG